MDKKSPAAQRICNAAAEHFSLRGYDGASLNEIAEMAGIRKATLYSHFKSKDQLFIQVLDDAIEAECEFARSMLQTEDAAPGNAYLAAINERFGQSVYFRYLLRSIYWPPDKLHCVIDKVYRNFLDNVADAFHAQLLRFVHDGLTESDRMLLVQSYIGIVESLYVEIIYSSTGEMDKRRKALWTIFSDSLVLRLRGAEIPEDKESVS
ncbi:hypothetical protein BIY27_00015 [Gibbsiella quercinecans]|uniref:TetR/AcrR family transcriptional regulator n=1 Tax=Gibbsiella quercinecans TaxID=929813 RepID=UPI000EF19303|nr:TetR/AcrR family transcriptional regulator [Gibbsiella quercinecans]RLM16509.1 hypothetical protein BIY27_00015 [Gibbsiella quercinecans]